jgi:phosphoadenosine phosphosulfate reductase
VSGVATVIDRSKGLTPRAFDRPGTGANDPLLKSKLARLEAEADRRDAHGQIELALNEEFPGEAAVVSSFGSESAVLLHMVSKIDPTTPVLFINTGKLFGETLRYRDRLQDLLGLGDVRTLAPHLADRAEKDPDGTLWSRDTDACCNFRKVTPIRRALEGFAAQITGRKRFQTQARAGMRAVEYFDGRFRFNPLAEWTQADLETYIARHDLPRHPLVEDGYPSIGCMPCTRRVHAGEAYRDGRWSGQDKDECGIHGVDGEGI